MYRKLISCVALMLATACPLTSVAQSNPKTAFTDNTVRIIVPYPAGGSVDFTARLLASALSEHWDNTVIVENRSGAAAVIGTQHVARSKPDGHTILMATAGMSIQPAVYDLPYDVFKDFIPVTQIVTSPSLLSINPEIPAKTADELVTYLKENPDTPFGSQGVGTHAHLLMEILRAEAGLDLLHVPYRGSAPATQALLSGETLLHFDIMLSMIPNIAAGNAVPMLVTTAERQKLLPDVPTAREAGLPALEASSWSGFFVPAETPAAIVKEISEGTRAVLNSPEIAARLSDSGFVLEGTTPEQFKEFFRQDVERYQEAAKNANLNKATPN